MRRIGRRLSGSSAKEDWREAGLIVIPSVRESTEGARGRIATGACKLRLNAARSGAVALGKVASRQPSQSDACCVSIDEKTRGWFCFPALSRAQEDTQATNSHTKVTGRNAAISPLSGKRDVNIRGIIHVRWTVSHSAPQAACL
jgi:Tfp pilus assembly protein FimT